MLRLAQCPALFAFILALGAAASAVSAAEPTHVARYLVVEDHGRLKSFERFAPETLRFISGSPRIEERDPVVTVVSIMAVPEHWQNQPLIRIPSQDLAVRLGLSQDAERTSYKHLKHNRTFGRLLATATVKQNRHKPLSPLEEEAVSVHQRFMTLKQLMDQELRMVPPSTQAQEGWLPILNPEGYPWQQQAAVKQVWGELLKAFENESDSQASATTRRLIAMLRHLNPQEYSRGFQEIARASQDCSLQAWALWPEALSVWPSADSSCAAMQASIRPSAEYSLSMIQKEARSMPEP